MTILHIIPSMHMGGAEKFAVDLANELAIDNSNDIYLCSIGKIDENDILPKQVSPKVHLISLNKTTGYSIRIVFKIYSLIKEIHPDLVHTHLRALMYSAFSLVLNKIPTIHTIHNLAQNETTPNIRKIYKILFTFFNIIPVSISDVVLESTEKCYGDRHSELVYNGVKALSITNEYSNVKNEIEKYKNKEDTLVFLSVGRISNQKNQAMLIDAMSNLANDHVLLIIGALDSEIEYAQQCLDLAENSENIYFLGLKSNIGDYMTCSDALCLSSLYEGLPLVVLEAMSMGVPTLSTPAGGVPDVVESTINGYISKDFTAQSYESILKQYAMHPIDNSEVIKELYEKNYSMAICKQRYYALYQKALHVT